MANFKTPLLFISALVLVHYGTAHMSWKFQKGIDYGGNDIKCSPGSESDCIIRCEKDDKCVGVAMFKLPRDRARTQRCCTKRKMANKRRLRFVTTGWKNEGGNKPWTFEDTIDYSGNDIKCYFASEVNCMKDCEKAKKCVGTAMFNLRGRQRCCLKHALAGRRVHHNKALKIKTGILNRALL